jgi:hypothetical protein
MGFGFNLIGFPLLILSTIGLLIYFFVSKKKISLKILGAIWGLTILVIITAIIRDHYRTPIRLRKSEIIGAYSIDTNFFEGTNAKWQYDHYKFKITKTDSFYFYVTSKDTVLKTFMGRVKYSSGPPDLWTVQSDTSYHVIKYPPTLFRGHSKFYYVFHSDIYGNMFFRKQN